MRQIDRKTGDICLIEIEIEIGVEIVIEIEIETRRDETRQDKIRLH